MLAAGLFGGCSASRAASPNVLVYQIYGAGGKDGCRRFGRGLAHELLAEAGATRIRDHHDLTLHYVRELGLNLVPFEAPVLRKTLHIADRNFTPGAGERVEWPSPLTAAERDRGLDGLLQRYLIGHTLKLRPQARDLRLPEGLKAYDGLTMRQFFARQGLSPAAAKLVFLGYPEPDWVRAWVLNSVENVTSCGQVYRIEGAMTGFRSPSPLA